ncbi:hypothetical protein SAMN05421639_104521 [Chryseobacterium shigense]|uniref:Uncharacterized protein n=1 Tax=Chryseobacterium shigense TaxID=297244 RepID=A0A1N7ISS8_9FLAO|nr:hypothetical protein SAMN05421639_104521 [Chryseobacterium shigense]
MNVHLIINTNVFILIYTKKSNVKKREARDGPLKKYTDNRQ